MPEVWPEIYLICAGIVATPQMHLVNFSSPNFISKQQNIFVGNTKSFQFMDTLSDLMTIRLPSIFQVHVTYSLVTWPTRWYIYARSMNEPHTSWFLFSLSWASVWVTAKLLLVHSLMLLTLLVLCLLLSPLLSMDSTLNDGLWEMARSCIISTHLNFFSFKECGTSCVKTPCTGPCVKWLVKETVQKISSAWIFICSSDINVHDS